MVRYLLSVVQNNKSNGFTLIELLIVLSITFIFILLFIPMGRETIDRVEENSFTTLLESDVLFLQNTSRGGTGLYSLIFSNEFYFLQRGAVLRKSRNYPEGWRLDSLNRPVSFDSDGRIRYPGTVTLLTKDGTYDLIFAFGRGRYRIEK